MAWTCGIHIVIFTTHYNSTVGTRFNHTVHVSIRNSSTFDCTKMSTRLWTEHCNERIDSKDEFSWMLTACDEKGNCDFKTGPEYCYSGGYSSTCGVNKITLEGRNKIYCESGCVAATYTWEGGYKYRITGFPQNTIYVYNSFIPP